MTPAPKRRWFRFTLRTMFVVVTVASLIALTAVQAVKLGSLQSEVDALQNKVDALEMRDAAFREMLRTKPPLAIDSADPYQAHPAAQ
jgi:hypothetical protein